MENVGERNKMIKSTFYISINDGFVEYEYPFPIPNTFCINDVYKKICEAFHIESNNKGRIGRKDLWKAKKNGQ